MPSQLRARLLAMKFFYYFVWEAWYVTASVYLEDEGGTENTPTRRPETRRGN